MTNHGLIRGILASALALIIAACTGTEQTLQPIPENGISTAASAPGSAQSIPAQTPPPPVQPAISETVPVTPVVAAPGQTRGEIRFTPVIGAPVNAVTPLSRQLAVESRSLGLKILSAADPGGDHVLKGYFSADFFEGNATVFFVWDVLDPAGNRLHRIQGQESTQVAAGSDVWAAVPASLMETIASRTMREYASWRGLR